MKNIRFDPGTHINEFMNCAYEKWKFDVDPEAKKHGNHKPYHGTGTEAFRGPKLKARKEE